jgi:bacterioferritin
MLTDRILELDGTPILDPSEWSKLTNCGYEVPKDFYTEPILKQNIKGEQCAIDVYNKLINFVHGKDPITYNMVLEILTDEVEHEDDLQTLLEDLQKKMD